VLSPEEAAELARRIRSGDIPEGARALLEREVAAKLRVASPRYLDRYR
jgi:DNA-binding FadR family transcriptional regulator